MYHDMNRYWNRLEMNFLKIQNTEILGATLLITGCCIGAGMIGLPVLSALAGLIPSTLAMFLCYLFTTTTGLLILEATLWFEHKVNLPSIVEATLGKTGKWLTLGLFIFLFYCLFVAYLDSGGTFFAEIISRIFHTTVSHHIGILICASLVATITYLGTKIVDNLNRGLLIGMIISYVMLISLGLPNINSANLAYANWSASLATIPILLICFGYQNLVPSLTYYLKKNVNPIRFSIIVGNLIPFFIYFFWNYVILGMTSALGSASVKEAQFVTELLQNTPHTISVLTFVKAFSFFAMLTSFIPCAISFVDFLQDGLNKTFHFKQKHQFMLIGFVFLPPLFCTLSYPHLFLRALEFAGGFIDVLLFGILPASVVLVGRHIKRISGPYQVAGGYLTPIAILILSFLVLMIKLS